MEHVANRGMTYEDGEDFIRLNIVVDDGEVQHGCFYLSGQHFCWLTFAVADRPVRAVNDDEVEEPLTAA